MSFSDIKNLVLFLISFTNKLESSSSFMKLILVSISKSLSRSIFIIRFKSLFALFKLFDKFNRLILSEFTSTSAFKTSRLFVCPYSYWVNFLSYLFLDISKAFFRIFSSSVNNWRRVFSMISFASNLDFEYNSFDFLKLNFLPDASIKL